MKTILPFFLLLFFLSACEVSPPPWAKYPDGPELETLAKLPKSIPESSGLIYWQNELWTINDGGNGPYLFQVGINKKDKKRTIKVKKVNNTDWESIAQDSQFVYIGDFGNNAGKRKNLAIHLVKKTALAEAKDKVDISGTIAFTYADQKEFSHFGKNHNFDCEAMISRGDSLYLFSKNHRDQQCNIYRLSKELGQQEAQLVGHFNSDGKITGVAFSEENQLLVLLGYHSSGGSHRPFLWLFSDYPEQQFFEGKKKRINLSKHLQMEAIAHFDKNQFLITNESERSSINGKIFKIDLKDYQ